MRKRFTRTTSATSSSTERKRCSTPMPPSCASAIAIGAVVTVSMLAETTGISSAIRRVSCVRVETSARERMRERRGTSSTSSNVSARGSSCMRAPA